MESIYKFDKKVTNSFVGLLSEFRSLKKISKDAVFHFSLYKNGPAGSGRTEKRRIVPMTKSLISLEKDTIIEIPGGFEIAFNSNIVIDKKVYHLPLIDFIYPYQDGALIEGINTIKALYKKRLFILKTGRSYHGYLDLLLTDAQWKKYLGDLLLLNKVNCNDVVDSRWVGHSLKNGFSSLRISFNTNRYLEAPTMIERY